MDNSRNMKYAEDLAKLIRYETISVWEGTDEKKFHGFHQLLREAFPLVFKTMDVQEFDCSLLLRWKGKTDEKPIMLMSHHDVVEASGKWSHEPFSGDIADGKLWGRGTLDTKGNLWAMLQAAEELISDGVVPQRDVYIESACTEETSGYGADTISRKLAEDGIEFFMTLDEGGMILPDPLGFTDKTCAMVGIGEKGCADLKFVARSNGGHASMPGKNTPLVRLGKFMAAAEKAKLFEVHCPDVVAEMFGRLAPYTKAPLNVICRNAGKLKGLLGKIMPLVSPAAGAMVKTTLAFTQSCGSDGTNVLPQEAYVIGNMRFSHHQGGKDSIRKVSDFAKKFDIETEILDPGFESSLSDFNSEGFKLVEKAIDEIFPGVVTLPYIMTSASDSRYFDRVCDCCIRFAPFSIDEQQLDSIHGVNENIDISSLSGAVDFYKYIISEV